MPEKFRRGERVKWNFRGRRVTGKVRRKLTSRTEIAGRPVAASKDDRRYLVRTDKTRWVSFKRVGAGAGDGGLGVERDVSRRMSERDRPGQPAGEG